MRRIIGALGTALLIASAGCGGTTTKTVTVASTVAAPVPVTTSAPVASATSDTTTEATSAASSTSDSQSSVSQAIVDAGATARVTYAQGLIEQLWTDQKNQIRACTAALGKQAQSTTVLVTFTKFNACVLKARDAFDTAYTTSIPGLKAVDQTDGTCRRAVSKAETDLDQYRSAATLLANVTDTPSFARLSTAAIKKIGDLVTDSNNFAANCSPS